MWPQSKPICYASRIGRSPQNAIFSNLEVEPKTHICSYFWGSKCPHKASIHLHRCIYMTDTRNVLSHHRDQSLDIESESKIQVTAHISCYLQLELLFMKMGLLNIFRQTKLLQEVMAMAAKWGVYKKAVLKNFTIFTGKHLCCSLFSEYCEIFKGTFFEEHLRAAAYGG